MYSRFSLMHAINYSDFDLSISICVSNYLFVILLVLLFCSFDRLFTLHHIMDLNLSYFILISCRCTIALAIHVTLSATMVAIP